MATPRWSLRPDAVGHGAGRIQTVAGHSLYAPRTALSTLLIAAFAVMVPRLEAAESPVARHYRDGETLRYVIDGAHTQDGVLNHSYHGEADVVVKKGEDGVFHEEFTWRALKDDGADISLPPDAADFRQLLSLDPAYKFGIPDLSKVGIIGGQITDTMTFYVDDRLAIGHAVLQKAGDKLHIPYGKPSSWSRPEVPTGYDCIDFEVSIVSLSGETATLHVRHVPPPAICGQVPAEWMTKPVADTVNNWFQVEKNAKGLYEAGAGKEVFDADVVVLLPSGIIRSATMHNPVLIHQKTCRDAALSDCGPIEKTEIVREITFTLADKELAPERAPSAPK
jgi:hypothetical protein